MQPTDSSACMGYNFGSMSEQGDSSSAEEVESPRSVVTAAVAKKGGGVGVDGRWRRWRKRYTNRNNNNNNSYKTNTATNNNNGEGEKVKSYIHSRVLRVKEEELQVGEYLMGDFGICNINYAPYSCPIVVDDDDDSFKMVLPASPLGAKKNY